MASRGKIKGGKGEKSPAHCNIFVLLYRFSEAKNV